MKVWRNTQSQSFRLSSPPDADKANWTEVESDKLELAERVDLKLDQFGEEQSNRMKSLEREMDALKAKILERATAPAAAPEKPEQISLCKLFRGITTKNWDGAELERHVVTSDKARALAASTDAAGGYMVPAEYLASEFIPLVRANTVLDKVKARFLNNLRGSPINIPMQTSGATAYWVGEAASITDSSQGTGLLSLRPRKVAALTKVSNELIIQADPSAEAFVREDLSRVLGLALDLGALKGTGASGQPLGIYYTASINTSSATGAIPNTVFDMASTLEVDNVDTSSPSCAAVMHPTGWNLVRKVAAAAGYPKSYAGAGFKVIEEACGWPVYMSSQLASTDAIFGKWDDLIIASWAGFSFRASQDAGDSFVYDQTWMRATMLVDVGIRNLNSFCLNTVFGT